MVGSIRPNREYRWALNRNTSWNRGVVHLRKHMEINLTYQVPNLGLKAEDLDRHQKSPQRASLIRRIFSCTGQCRWCNSIVADKCVARFAPRSRLKPSAPQRITPVEHYVNAVSLLSSKENTAIDVQKIKC